MKITLIVLLSVVTLAVCTIPEPFKEKKKTCICKEKECTDVSCEEKNCLCIVKAIKSLLAAKDARYPKKWLEYYLQIVQERCLCIERCQNICSPKEFIDCTSHAFNVFNCKYQKFLAGIAKDKGYEHFIKDINRIIRECLNKDCKPICSGDGDCNPFHVKPKDCGCTQKCIVKFLEELAKSLHNYEAREIIENLIVYIETYYHQYNACLQHKTPSQQAFCFELIRGEIDDILRKTEQQLIKKIGACTAIGIISAILQGAGNCLYA